MFQCKYCIIARGLITALTFNVIASLLAASKKSYNIFAFLFYVKHPNEMQLRLLHFDGVTDYCVGLLAMCGLLQKNSAVFVILLVFFLNCVGFGESKVVFAGYGRQA